MYATYPLITSYMYVCTYDICWFESLHCPFRSIEFPTQVECQKWRDRFLVVLANRGLKSAFSLRHFAAIMDSRQELKQSGSELELSSQLVREEFDKLQMNLGSCWKITDINQHFE